MWPLIREARDLAPVRLRRPQQGSDDRHGQDNAQPAVVALLPSVHRAARSAVGPIAVEASPLELQAGGRLWAGVKHSGV